MPDKKYLIIGGGMTAAAAVKGIRQLDSSAGIEIISREEYPPYKRPALSKGLWKGDALETIWLKSAVEKVDVHLSRTVKSVNPVKKVVIDDNGTEYSFDKLLLATGGTVRRLPYAVDGINYFRTLADYYSLKASAQPGKKVAVIGGGFIGSEIAAALALNSVAVTMIFPETGIGARIYPPALSQFLNTFYQSKGVEVLAGDGVAKIEKKNSMYAIKTTNGKELHFDGVVAGLGIQPNVELAQSAGLATDNGIVVDEFLRTSHPDIYAAGDAANFFNPALGKRIRVEHEDDANTMGEIAGKNMAGSTIAYNHLPFFYSDLFELGYEGIGELDARLQIVEDWKEEFREGVVYYLQEGRVRGVLLWNTWGQIDAARSLIEQKGPFNAQGVKGRLPA